MQSTDWYSRTLLTCVAGLLLVIATELRGSRPGAGLLAEAPANTGFQPQPVSLRPADPELAPPAVLNVRLVGYQYRLGKAVQDVDFGNYTIAGEGLPTMSGENLRQHLPK